MRFLSFGESSLLVVDVQQGFTTLRPQELPVPGGLENLYPPHCVAGTPGAEFLPGLRTDRFHTIWRKGYRRDFEAYAVTAQHPGFSDSLRASGISTVAVCGIATNICCFFAARDLRKAGFQVLLVEDASAGIDVPAANLFQAQAKAQGQAMGIRYLTGEELGSLFQAASIDSKA
jgi:nicotinamidase/pyrazinamidase